MQFGHALDRYLREILLADPTLGPIYMLKLDIADGFYRIAINIEDIPKLGVVFPTRPNQPPLVAFQLVLSMGWKNSPPAFCVATETVADLANDTIASNTPPPPIHPLNHHAARLDQPCHKQQPNTAQHHDPTVFTHPREPCLPFSGAPIS